MSPTRFPLADEIPAQQLRIERLARDLAPSVHDAEDLAQEAWLAALRRRGQGIDHLGGWMRTVTVRLASKLAVRGRSKREWETRAARPEAESSFVDSLERRSLREYLERQIDALRSPYAEVLRMRYLEERAPEEIAAKLGRSGGTVRSQINRGLAQLRVRVNGDLDAERGLKSVLFFWIARRSTQALLAAGVLMAVGALFLFPSGPRQDGVRLAELRPVALLAPPVDEVPDAIGEAAGSALREPAPAPASGMAALGSRTVELSGRVVDHTGVPVSGAEVWLAPREGEDPTLHTLADEAGAFRLEGVLPTSWVGARDEGRYPTPQFLVASFVREGSAELELVIPREVPGKLVVAVRDAADQPVPGARLRVIPGYTRDPFVGPDLALRRHPADYLGRSDAQGLFESWKLGGRVSYVIVEAEGHPRWVAKTRRPFLLPERVVVRLPHTSVLAGGLRLPDGTPARGARILLEQDPMLGEREAYAGADGAFAFDGLVPGPYRLRIIAGQLASLVHRGEVSEGEDVLDLELALGVSDSVAGVVMDTSDIPMAGARVTLGPWTTVTDAHGAFHFGAVGELKEGERVLRAFDHDGDLPLAWRGGCVAGQTDLRLVAQRPGASVRGHLVGLGPHMRVTLRAPFLANELPLELHEGSFASGPLQPGVYELVARDRAGIGSVVQRFALAFDQAQDLGDLALPLPGSLEWRLTGTPPIGDRIPQLTLLSDLLTLRCLTSFEPGEDGGGTLRVEEIPPGTYDAFLTTPGFADVLETIEVAPGAAPARDLVLSEGYRRDFTLHLPGAGNASGVLPELRLVGPGGSRRVFTNAQRRPDDREGLYLSLNLAPGSYTLVAETEELLGETSFSVEGRLPQASRNPHRIELRAR